MNTLRKWLGLVWISLALVAGYYLIVSQAIPKFNSSNPEDRIPAIIYSFILMPIITGGLLLFGYYAWKQEYDIDK